MTFLLCLIPGCAAVQLCFAGRQAALPLLAAAPMILLPGLAGGQLYRRVLEKRDSLPTVPYLLCLVVLRVLLLHPVREPRVSALQLLVFRLRRIRRDAGAALAIAFICGFPACSRRISSRAGSRWPSAETRSIL